MNFSFIAEMKARNAFKGLSKIFFKNFDLASDKRYDVLENSF